VDRNSMGAVTTICPPKTKASQTLLSHGKLVRTAPRSLLNQARLCANLRELAPLYRVAALRG